MKKIITLIVLLFSIVSCVSIKPANTIDKAETRIIKLNDGIQNQIERYPSLIDKAYQTIKYDTVFIESDSSELELLYQNIDFLDSLNKSYQKSIDKQSSYIDSVSNLPEVIYPIEFDSVAQILKNRNQDLLKKIIELNFEKDSVFKLYTNEVNKKTQGVYKDSLFTVNYIFDRGILNLVIKTNDKFKVVPVEYNDYTIKAKKHFWQDIKFYGFLIVVLNSIYFFGKELQHILKSLMKKIILFFRKLILKF